MTPAELAARHPRLYHVTLPGAWPAIERHGLLSTSALLDGMDLDPPARAAIEQTCRPRAVPLVGHPFGDVVLNDQSPMSDRALAGCLDDGLAPADWLRRLNGRVFFWADEAGLARLLGARANRGRAVLVLTLDTLALAEAYGGRMALSPINSGATIRRPARRGLSTFTPLGTGSYAEWARLRGRRDRVLEVTVAGGVVDVGRFLVGRVVAEG